tara:strand:+ start:65 stop:589 length:525 start_codon:yes stop_codon:yes gene_type:complete
MPDYQLGKIYLITSEKHKLIYVGSTAQTYIFNRIRCHIASYKTGRKKCCSQKVLECDDYNYKLLKDFPCNNKQQLMREEGFWILHYKEQPDYECVNQIVAGRTRKERDEANRDKIREQMKEYCKNNKDKKKEQDKKRYEKNQDKILEQKKEYYKNNKNKILAKMKEQRESQKMN